MGGWPETSGLRVQNTNIVMRPIRGINGRRSLARVCLCTSRYNIFVKCGIIASFQPRQPVGQMKSRRPHLNERARQKSSAMCLCVSLLVFLFRPPRIGAGKFDGRPAPAGLAGGVRVSRAQDDVREDGGEPGRGFEVSGGVVRRDQGESRARGVKKV